MSAQLLHHLRSLLSSICVNENKEAFSKRDYLGARRLKVTKNYLQGSNAHHENLNPVAPGG